MSLSQPVDPVLPPLAFEGQTLEVRPWADDLLDTDTLRRQGLLDASYVGRLWSEHRSGRRDHQFILWGLLMLQAWLEAQKAPRPVRAP